MPNSWFKRKEHTRRLASGKLTFVSACWVPCKMSSHDTTRRRTRSCPQCGAVISTVKMPNRGWVHFETGKGLSRVKHPCLHRGEGLSRRRDKDTPDLFAGNEITHEEDQDRSHSNRRD